MGNLLQWGEPFRLHSGAKSRFKIDADALSESDCLAVAEVMAPCLPPFAVVEAVPSSGSAAGWLAQSFVHLCSPSGGLLIVDDVLTTGASMEDQRGGREAIGAVIFARGPVPSWVTPMFKLSERIGRP